KNGTYLSKKPSNKFREFAATGGKLPKLIREMFASREAARIQITCTLSYLLHIPHLHRLIPRARRNPLAIRRPCNAANPISVTSISRDSSTRERIPDLYGFVKTAGGNGGAVGRPDGGGDTAVMSSIHKDLTPCSCIPHLHRR